MKWVIGRFLSERRGWLSYYGTKIYFPNGSYAARCILNYGSYENDIQLAMIAATQDDSVVFDVGANIGVSSIPLLSKRPRCRVVSIEASPGVLAYLNKTHQECAFKERWEIVRKAAIQRPGKDISFTVHGSGGDVFDGILHTGRAPSATTVPVPTTSIDTEWELRDCPKVSLLKIDTEGAEIGVLNGAVKCLKACRPYIITEWCPKNFKAYGNRPEEMWNLARDLDYSVFAIPSMSPVTRPDILSIVLEIQENLLLVPNPTRRPPDVSVAG